jgi:hypothetical protein
VELTLLCWEWRGAKTAGGYGALWVDGRMMYAHRFSYEQRHGAINFGYELDHLCCNRGCVNPDHLEPVSHCVNVQRGFARRKAAA